LNFKLITEVNYYILIIQYSLLLNHQLTKKLYFS